MTTRRARGFTLSELIFTLMLLSVFSVIASRLFANIVTVFHQTTIAQSRISAYESAVALLRKDVWSASRIEVSDPTHARLSCPDGRSISWALEPTGQILRAENSGLATRWNASAQTLLFKKEPAALVLTDPAADPTLSTRFTSQVILGGGAQ